MDERMFAMMQEILKALNGIAVELGLLRKQVAKLNEIPVDVEVDGKPSQE